MPFPPSVNGYWRNFRNRQIISAKGRAYRKNAIKSIKDQGWYEEGVSGRLKVVIHLHPPSSHRRDVDNYSKAPLDALSHAGFWIDDSQVKILTIEMRNKIKGGKLKVYVEVLE